MISLISHLLAGERALFLGAMGAGSQGWRSLHPVFHTHAVIDVEIAAPAKHRRNEDDDDDMPTKRGGWRCVYEGRRRKRRGAKGGRREERREPTPSVFILLFTNW